MKRAIMSLASLALAGCTTVLIARAPPEPVQAEAAPQITTRSFLIRGPRFPVGQAANVRVCVDASGAVISAEVVGSSGESRFDEFAITWARQADMQNWARKRARQPSCGNVHVEIGPGSRQQLGSNVDSALG